MLSQSFRDRVRALTATLVKATLAHTRLTATTLTVVGCILHVGALWLLARGLFFWAGCVVALAGSFDMLDGALARAKNEVSRIGAFLDSTLDRYTEVLIFFGLLLHYQRTAPQSIEIALIYAAVTGSLLVSYARARAEALDFNGQMGWLERPERIVLIVFGLLTGWMTPALWLLAVLTHLTAAQRLVHVWRQSRVDNGPKRPLPVVHSSE